jgi:DNA-binding MarR family transcriptional regulator
MSTDPFDLDSADELRRSVGVLVRAVRDRTAHESDGQIETLGFLMRDGAQSIAALARLRRIRHQSASAVVAELERAGLVARAPDPDDARGVLITLTTAGSDVVTESRRLRAGVVLEAARESLSIDERALLARVPALLDALSEAMADR